MTDIITATGLVKRYGKVTALSGLDLVVPEGTVLGLLGPNGAGKTTAVRILATLLKPDAGSAQVAGVDVVGDPDGVRRRIGLSGQYAAVDEHLTGFENLEMVGRLYGMPATAARARARELLERFSLADAGDRPSKTYSGGMRRRLDLAGALVASPPVLILDEPTTGLDPRSRNEMWDVIRELVAGGATLLLTTQYLEEADRLADDIVVIDHGREIARGTADQLKAQTGGERVEAVLADAGDREVAQRVLAEIAMAGSEVQVDESGRTLTAAVSAGVPDLRRALDGFDASGIHLLDVGLRRPTLDDVFLSLTGQLADAADTAGADETDTAGAETTEESRMSTLTRAASDGWVVTRRNLIKIKRVPEVLVFVLISPIMFILLFAFVFEGAIGAEGGVGYREFLIGGIFAQTVVFGATFTGAGLAEDMQKGIIDRFRSLPMAPSAVLVGRTTSDVVYNVLSLAIMALTGLLIGWRVREGIVDAALGFGLLLVFAYAISWVMAYVGLLVPSVEVINNASFIVIMPLTFVSNAFVPLESFSGFLRTLVEWNPVSTLTQACRELFGNYDPRVSVGDAWSMQHPALYTLIWVAIILVVFVPLSVRQYRRTTSR